eukprot:TRINITY_DN4487_c0_g1_i3.p1 TRINITY_DN4487_c0_g1~~TRINITY_DN4487_c0_g1_i3.p1  ORF type:complete len:124 (-),score=36.57 TRINITY_DN4487_c0_g1_i3:340-711(-)
MVVMMNFIFFPLLIACSRDLGTRTWISVGADLNRFYSTLLEIPLELILEDVPVQIHRRYERTEERRDVRDDDTVVRREKNKEGEEKTVPDMETSVERSPNHHPGGRNAQPQKGPKRRIQANKW